MSDEGKRRDVGVALLAGTLIGVGLGILFAPQSGQKTRRDMRRLGERAMEKAESFQDDLRESLDGMIEDVCGVTREALEKGRKVAEEKKDEALERIDRAVDFLEDQKGFLRRIVH